MAAASSAMVSILARVSKKYVRLTLALRKRQRITPADLLCGLLLILASLVMLNI